MTQRALAIGGPRIRVRVTEGDIKWAVREDSTRCMVARAIAREVDDAARIEVDTQTIRFTTAKGRFAYLTPLAVQRYVATFDAGDSIEPFEFTIQSPMVLRRRVLTPEERDEARFQRLTESTEGGVGRSSSANRRGVTDRADGENRKAPPRVFKTRKRTYGHRLLRINQPMQPTALDEPSVP